MSPDLPPASTARVHPRGPLVTVVIPAFNRAATIEAALRSVRAQTCSNWEAIVVDDGSSDDTVRIAERCAHADARIRVVRHAQNRGAQAARNTGIEHACGAWIAFLDSDDRWVPGSLQLRLEAAARHRVSVVHSHAYRTHEDGRTVLYELPPMEGWIYRELLSDPGPVFPALLVAREALAHIGGLDEDLVGLQEWDTAIRLAERYAFGFVRSPTFIWDRRSDETISKDKARNAWGYEQVVRKHTAVILDHLGPAALARHYAILAVRYLHARRQSEVFRCLRTLRGLDGGTGLRDRSGEGRSFKRMSPAREAPPARFRRSKGRRRPGTG